MYAQYFGLKENPFALPPDPQYLYLSRRHEEALAHLIFGITEGAGFVQLTGEVGTGKTMMIRAVLERLPQNVDVALVLYPRLSVREFVAAICDDLAVAYPRDTASLKALIDALNSYLLQNHANGRRTVLIIDEAHLLSHDVLEQVRLLTNLETTKEKLLQILLVGQPELVAMLAQPGLRQLAQRVTARYELRPLQKDEARDYVLHRCQVAGAKGPLFSRSALRWIFRLTGGVPRLINIVCDRALLGAYARGKSLVTAGIVHHAAAEVGQGLPAAAWRRPVVTLTVATGLVLIVLAGWYFSPAFLRIAAHALDVAGLAPPGEPVPVSEPAPPPAPTATATPEPTPATAVTEPPTVAPEPPAPSLARLLREPTVRTDTDAAFSSLFARWHIDYAQFAGSGCERAMRAGLRCLLVSGTWNNLRRYNRPGLIELVDGAGDRHHVLLTGLTDDKATLDFGGPTYVLPLSEINQYWFGKYLLVWQPPPLEERVLKRGMRGTGVVWLRQTLARFRGQAAADAPGPLFDAALEDEVKEFQRRHQLEDDGIVGPMTLVHLSAYDPPTAAPVLSELLRVGAR